MRNGRITPSEVLWPLGGIKGLPQPIFYSGCYAEPFPAFSEQILRKPLKVRPGCRPEIGHRGGSQYRKPDFEPETLDYPNFDRARRKRGHYGKIPQKKTLYKPRRRVLLRGPLHGASPKHKRVSV